jgi:hypothetical protein
MLCEQLIWDDYLEIRDGTRENRDERLQLMGVPKAFDSKITY